MIGSWSAIPPGAIPEVLCGMHRGLDRFVARTQLWDDLERAGLTIKKESRTQRVPRSQRGGEVSMSAVPLKSIKT